VSALGRVLSRMTRAAPALRWPAAVLLVAACVVLVMNRDSLLNEKISSLSPVSQADIALDERLRTDMGAPDVRYLVVVSGASREAVLASSEQVSAVLQAQVDKGELAGFESPSRYLPSRATQQARQASLPSPEVLRERLTQGAQGLPVRPQLFAPFVADVEASRSKPLLQPADLEKTSMAMAVDALLLQQSRGWTALLPLRGLEGRGIAADSLREALASTRLTNVLFVDMKAESDSLYSGYLKEAALLSLGGLVGIVALLLVVFRSATRVWRTIVPLAAAVITVTAALALAGQPLIILHLVGLLLVVAVGSNYALFFDRPDPLVPIPYRTLASMALANATTVAGFGLLAFSKISILQAMGQTVAPGVILALVYAAIFSRQTHAPD
jgi:predicted exporter